MKRIQKKKIFQDNRMAGLTASPELLSSMVNAIGDELMVINSRGRIVYVNDATARGLGYRHSRILGRPITDFFKEKITIKQWQMEYFSELKRRKKPIKYQIERVIKGKKLRIIDVTAVYMKFRSDGLIISVARDITEQLDIERAMRQSEDLYRLVCEGAGDAILIIDLDGRIVYANRAAEKNFDRTQKKIKGAPFRNFVDQASWAKALSYFRRAGNAQSRFQLEMEAVVGKGKTIPVEVTATPLKRNGKIKYVHVIARDIRQKKEVEKLEVETQRMEAIQHFISGMAQELNHPLLAILSRTRALLKQYEHRDFEYVSFKEYSLILKSIKSINRQIKYCYDTSRRLIDLNKKKLGLKKGTCNPHKVIKDYFSLIAKEMKSQDIQIRLRLSSQINDIAIDAIEFNQIINGIVTNAIQAMPGGGILSVKTTLHVKQQFVDITISDNGIGIGRDELQHIFEPFFTTKHRSLEGHSGLGLPIVLSLVKGAGGDIIIESNLRKGTSVKLMFPLARVIQK